MSFKNDPVSRTYKCAQPNCVIKAVLQIGSNVLVPSAIINSSALAASNISKHRENNSPAFRKGGSPAGS